MMGQLVLGLLAVFAGCTYLVVGLVVIFYFYFLKFLLLPYVRSLWWLIANVALACCIIA